MLESEHKMRMTEVRRTHCNTEAVSLSNESYRKEVIRFFGQSISMDLMKRGDITTDAVLKKSAVPVKAFIRAKSAGMAAGLEELAFYFRKDPIFKALSKDGQLFVTGSNLAYLSGTAREILKVERTVLNFLQRMCGVATMTQKFIGSMSSGPLLTATRKTIWPLLDKKAVSVAGGGTHRMDLSDAILVKDNHLKLLNNDFNAVFKGISSAKTVGRFMEIEAQSVEAAFECIDIYEKVRTAKKIKSPLYLMLDNFKPSEIKKVVDGVKKRKIYRYVYFEASGGINPRNVKAYANTGVDLISSGALTHSAPAIDISLDVSFASNQDR